MFDVQCSPPRRSPACAVHGAHFAQRRDRTVLVHELYAGGVRVPFGDEVIEETLAERSGQRVVPGEIVEFLRVTLPVEEQFPSVLDAVDKFVARIVSRRFGTWPSLFAEWRQAAR